MKHPKKSDAKRRAWQPGGAHRIAHEKRLQDKKTMDHRTSQPASTVIGHQKMGAVLNAAHVYRAACLLLLLDKPKPAERLIIAADALLGEIQ